MLVSKTTVDPDYINEDNLLQITITKLSNPANNALPLYIYDTAYCKGVYQKDSNGEYKEMTLAANNTSGYADTTKAYYWFSSGTHTFYVDLTGYSEFIIGKASQEVMSQNYGDGSFYYSEIIVPKNIKKLTWSFGGDTNYTPVSSFINSFYQSGGITTRVDLSESGITSIPADTFYTWNDYSDSYGTLNLTLPTGLTEIGAYGFRGAPITEITIPTSCKSIGDYAFDECLRLTSVNAHNGITNMGKYTLNETPWFENFGTDAPVILNNWLLGYNSSGNLEYITIPSTVTKVCQYAFYGETNLDSLWPGFGKITEIYDYAFYGCTNLNLGSLWQTLPDSEYDDNGLNDATCLITHIGRYAFYNAGSALDKVSTDELVIENDSIYGWKTNTISENYHKVELFAPCTVEAYAFTKSNISELRITSEGCVFNNYAFSGCTELMTIELNSFDSTKPTVGIYTFGSTSSSGNNQYSGCNSPAIQLGAYNELLISENDNSIEEGTTDYGWSYILDSSRCKFKIRRYSNEEEEEVETTTTTTTTTTTSIP